MNVFKRKRNIIKTLLGRKKITNHKTLCKQAGVINGQSMFQLQGPNVNFLMA
jgi:hypothetical protein